ncbi:unnamed protein product [Tilletia controversa]|uniref:Uncharacterized protein n=3 Tax=Tilletia TaxID=13289 RepID=A0A8X7N1R7_9BASI|nr:hypothetical protein CF336_g5008 [Tilletia laevis]KAE8194396.1 hypothetical protein CF328_g4758 [Tilletia controversa]KAE8258477.1 hypothetical protein A4X03_0g4368 [Tilletia caries]KAE8198672.1 hypothetical protein CF335_g4335 [Tilletia laevis]KAE8255699.1 hypothetical protein A4X06_0g308 [Tilletia controversa]
MARGDGASASGARKRPRMSRAGRASMGTAIAGAGGAMTAALPHHNAAFAPGLTADDVHGPINLLRLNGHRDPGRYAVVPEETQVLFDKDPEHDTLLWYPAPPLDGPTQVARQKNTLVKAPLHSLDYLYERIVKQQEQTAESAPAVGTQNALPEVEPPAKSKASSKRGKATRKRKAPTAAHAGESSAAIEHSEGEASNVHLLVEDNAEEVLSEGEAETQLLRSLQALAPRVPHPREE